MREGEGGVWGKGDKEIFLLDTIETRFYKGELNVSRNNITYLDVIILQCSHYIIE